MKTTLLDLSANSLAQPLEDVQSFSPSMLSHLGRCFDSQFGHVIVSYLVTCRLHLMAACGPHALADRVSDSEMRLRLWQRYSEVVASCSDYARANPLWAVRWAKYGHLIRWQGTGFDDSGRED